jgi:hypothetical protein
MTPRVPSVAAVLGIVSALPLLTAAQNNTPPGPASATLPPLTADYPRDRTGILIQSSDWISVPSEMPAKVRMKHGFAPALTYGIASAAAVTDYDGPHARVKVEPGRPVICICHVMSLPGNPALVRLHPKKDFRELDSGKLHIGAKVAEAEKNDLIPTNVSQPESTVWLVQPQQALPAGEYALMVGTQNMSIFPFTVAAASPSSVAPEKH